MSKKIDALEFVNKTIEGIDEYEKMTGKRPAAYICLDNLVEIQQALLKGQEFKDENKILLENISDLEDQNALYAKNLYNCEDILNIIITKEINLEDFKIYIETSDSDDEAFEDFNSMQPERNKITKDEYFKIKDVYYTIMDNFNKSKGKSE